MRFVRPWILFCAALGTFFSVQSVVAAPASVTYTYRHHIISINVLNHPEWRGTKRTWLYEGVPAEPPSRLKSCGPGDALEPGWSFQDTIDWDEAAISRTVEKDIAAKIDRTAGNVIIRRNASGSVVFDGVGLTGQKTLLAEAAALTAQALDTNLTTIVLPVEVTQPTIDVQDTSLREMGIKEVVMVGESVFSGSPVNRRHNIAVGLAKFNGHIIPKDSIFSFVEILGPVNATTGYRRELVIQGDTTLPDYGGGLCQVSSTAYRGPWEYGLPIVQRKNHSYAVNYYSPQGTDATIYPPNVDMKFKNDTPGALLIQTLSDDKDRAYFIYYGTHDDRESEVFGPYIFDRRYAPREEKTVYTLEIPPGEKRKAGERHDGMKVLWYRSVAYEGQEPTMESFFSAYEARPFTWQIGITQEEMASRTAGDLSTTPSSPPSNP